MSEATEGQLQAAPAENQPVNDQPTQPAPSGEISSLARLRAAQAQRDSAPAQQSAPAGQPTPSGNEAPQPQRSEYIPRERFDQVNARLQAAEARLAALQQGYGHPPTGMAPVAPQQPQHVTQSGMVGAAPQPSGQAVANSAQVQRLLDQLTQDKGKQEEWKKKIAANPVTGLAEFVTHAIQTEGAALLQQALAPIIAQVQPLQQAYLGQQLDAYAAQRQSDPTWQQVAPRFYALAQQAQAAGYPTTPQALAVVEAVARQQAGLPIFGAPAAPTPPPFTERPGSGGQSLVGSNPAPQLTPQEQAIAKYFKMTPEEYVQGKASLRSTL